MNPLLETLSRAQSLPGVEGFLATLAIKGSLLLAVGFAAALCLRRAPAAARHLAWCATFLGLLLVPVLAAWAPPVPLPLLAAADAGGVSGEPAQRAVPAEGWRASGPAVAGGPREAKGAKAPAAPAMGRAKLLPVGYLLGACSLLAYLVVGTLRARRLRRGARRLDPEPGWRGLVASLREALGIRRSLTVEATHRVAVPLAWGALRPTVLLPAAAETWNDDQRRDVLVHELAHVARHDWLSQLATRLVCAFYWFHPLVWVAARRLVLEAERACDDRVLAAGSDSCDYAERLLKVADAARTARDPSYAAVAMARRSDLATRIQAILDGRVRRGALRGAPATLLVGVLLLAAGLIAPLRLARAEAAPVTEPGEERAWREEPSAEALAELSPLLRAAHRGDLAEVRRQLDAGADPDRTEEVEDRRDELQRSPLGAAARGGHLEVARLLLARGADVDAAPRGDATPLMIAARHRHPDVAALLLENGADADRLIPGDGTPLIAAARSGDRQTARMLLAAGADPGRFVEGDESPLYHAIQNGDREMVQLLLDAGADPNAAVDGDGSPLIQAADGGRLEIVRRLVDSGADVDRVVPGDENPLIRAAGAGHLDVVRYLLDRGADPNVRTFEGPAPLRPEGEVRTPLTQARRGGHDDVVRLLLARGARE